MKSTPYEKIVTGTGLFSPIVCRGNSIQRIARELRSIPSICMRHELKCVLIRNPKSANSTILNYLYSKETGSKGLIENWDRAFLTKRYFEPIGGRNLFYGKKALDEYLFVMFSRDPYSRVLSAWLEKLEIDSFKRRFPDVEPASRSDNPEKAFFSFLSSLKSGRLYSDHHWAPQVSFAWPSVHRIDFMGSFEHLDNDLQRLSSALSLEGPSSGEIFRGVGSAKTNASTKIDRFYFNRKYGDKCRELVENLYEQDFLWFSKPKL